MLSLAPAPHIDQRRSARALYWQGWRVTDIAQSLGLKRTTVESWKTRDAWDDAPPIARVEVSIEARLTQLVLKEVKTGGDYKEIDLLGRQIERLARVRRYGEPGGHEGDLNPNIERRNAKPKRKPVRNAFSDDQKAQLLRTFDQQLFGYQRVWRKAGLTERIRNILKSRQIGATFYFAREALVDALETGRNQIFLSASKKQAHVCRADSRCNPFAMRSPTHVLTHVWAADHSGTKRTNADHLSLRYNNLQPKRGPIRTDAEGSWRPLSPPDH
ncbi:MULTISPECIES: terminase gpP N-terminus-related DNA-binding protein [Lysobacter]|uniref:terminase gpP N-terminus-related DNA-binding protein n=1 Tax=Lysobacter TaxID=68 RepID=UPI001F1BB8B0|nr:MULTISPECIES: terminase family protein [Lysobacter]UJB17554.1 terminase family protein [Lysobacter capsici]UJQ28724.1 terminase family protein [Lysobacter gummosus]